MITTIKGQQYEVPDDLIDRVYGEVHIADPSIWQPDPDLREAIVSAQRETIATLIVMVTQWRGRGDDLDELEREYLADLVRSGVERGFSESTIELKVAQGARAIKACREFLASS
jgi:hypothetical protein